MTELEFSKLASNLNNQDEIVQKDISNSQRILCVCCGRLLKNKDSIIRGKGPICAKKSLNN